MYTLLKNIVLYVHMLALFTHLFKIEISISKLKTNYLQWNAKKVQIGIIWFNTVKCKLVGENSLRKDGMISFFKRLFKIFTYYPCMKKFIKFAHENNVFSLSLTYYPTARRTILC